MTTKIRCPIVMTNFRSQNVTTLLKNAFRSQNVVADEDTLRQKAKIFGCLSYSTPISQTGISQKGNFWVSGLFQGQKVSGLFCTLRGK